MSIVLNERRLAESLLSENSLTKKPVEGLVVVSKYYFDKGYKKSEIVTLLEEYLIRADPKANLVKWRSIIDSVAKSAGKHPLVEVDSVPITEAEMAVCRSMDGVLKQRLTFTMLCFAKFYNMVNPDNNGWVNAPDKDLFPAANIAISIRKQALMISSMKDAGVIEFSKKVDNVNSRVTFICDDSPVVMNVSDFRNLGNQYRKYIGEPYVECKICGLVVKRKSGHTTYCKECVADVRRAREAAYKRSSYVSKAAF